MKKIKPEEFTETLKAVCGEHLQSVILYGSAAAGDYESAGSDYNLLVVLDDLRPDLLRKLARPVAAWERAGNPVPMLFTLRRLTGATDVFPMELLDMRDARKVLFGEDVIPGLTIDKAHLRLETERELRAALIHLRRSYLFACQNPRRMNALLTGPVFGVLNIFRAALRLYEDAVPLQKLAVLEKLNAHVPLAVEAFHKIYRLKKGGNKIKAEEAGILFEEALKSIEAVTDAVDQTAVEEKATASTVWKLCSDTVDQVSVEEKELGVNKENLVQEENVNPYEPPESSVEISAKNSKEVCFFSTSTFKLAVMSICTFGIYELYWFYKNWVLIKERTGENIMPFWRAFFAPLWAYSCFKRIKNSANENGVPESLPIGLLAIVYFVLLALVRLPDPYWLLSSLSFALLIPVNNVALSINNKMRSDFINNEKLSGWNWVGVVLGGLIFLLSLFGTFMPEV